MSEAIVNNRIAGTRITVWDVFYYLNAGWTPAKITEILPITEEQIRATMAYIEEHKEEVVAVHNEIEERNARGNPPWVEARREATRLKMEAWLAERRKQRAQEANGEGHPGGR